MRSLLFPLLIFISGCALFKTQAPVPAVITTETEGPRAIKAEATVELKNEKTVTGRAIILAKTPGSFRIEVKGPLGQTVLVLASNGETLTVFSKGESNTYHMGDPAIPYSFTPGELVAFLLGETGAREGFTVKKSLDGRAFEAVKFINEKPAVRVLMSDFRTTSGVALPYAITVEDGEKTLAIRYSKVEINPEVKEALFKIAVEP